MKLRKIISALFLTFMMTLSMTVIANAGTVSYTSSPAAGSTVTPGDEITVILRDSDGTKGFKKLEVKLYDASTNALLDTAVEEPNDQVRGGNPLAAEVIVPATCTSTGIKAVATGTSASGETTNQTFTFIGPNTGSGSESGSGSGANTNNGNTLTITPSVASGSTVTPGKSIIFVTTSSNSHVGTRTCAINVYNYSTGTLINDVSYTSSKALGGNPFNAEKLMPTTPGTYRVVVTSTDINGLVATGTFIYTVTDGNTGGGTVVVPDNNNNNNDDDDDDYEGIINSDLDGLVIDLWLREDTRFYELDEDDIPFVAYYYNSEKKTKDDVTIEVEIPDGFEVVSKSTPVGTVKERSDTLIYTIGDVESKKLGRVYFTLKAIDDDVCEEVTNVQAIIYSDDDEEDASTQRIWIYEEGDKGSFTSYVTGYTDGTFRPDNDITREEVAAIMARAFNHKVVNTTRTFSDIKTTGWAYNYIMACATKGIITGYTDGTFRPYNNIARSELYAMTYRAMDISTDEQALFVPKRYKNDDSWEKNYVAGLVRLKMLEDMDDTDPDENASRADVVYLVNGVQFRNPSKMMDVSYTDLSSGHWCAKEIAAASCNYSFKRGSNGKEVVIK